MTKVREMSAASATSETLPMWGMEEELPLAMRLLYYALKKDDKCQHALYVLAQHSSYLVSPAVELCLTEYALTVLTDESLRARALRSRHFLLHGLNLLTNTDANFYVNLPPEKWCDPEQFPYDEDRLHAIIKDVTCDRDLSSVFESMLTYMGYCSDFLIPVSKIRPINFNDCTNADDYTQIPEFLHFL